MVREKEKKAVIDLINLEKVQKDLVYAQMLKKKRVSTPLLAPIIDGKRKVSDEFLKIEDEICDFNFRILNEYNLVIKAIGFYKNNGYKSLFKYRLENRLDLSIIFLERLNVIKKKNKYY